MNQDKIFLVTKKQLKKASSWRKAHIEKCHNGVYPYAGAIGGSFGWKFIQTSLGEIVIHYCICKEEVNLTDFDSW